MSTQLNSANEGNGAADRGWWAGLLLRRSGTLLPRFAYYYRKVAALPRPWRRQMRRKLAVTATGAALLLALAGPVGPPVLAEPAAPEATITVVNGEVEIVNNGKCSLMEAIINARATSAGQLRADCTAGNLNGPDTVSLPSGGDFVLTAPHNSQNGPTGLPVITSSMTIEGHGATIRRSTTTGTPDFRILDVDAGATLTIRDTTIRDGRAYQYYDGGGILSRGNLIIENSTIAGNSGEEGGGIFTNQATITGSRITSNKACLLNPYCWNGGGGIYAKELTLIDSTVADNIAFGGEEWAGYGGGEGGGISIYGSGTIVGSTISGNRATVGWDGYNNFAPVPSLGGGISIKGDVTIVNSTISNNEANNGGGIRIQRGSVSLINSTLTGNNAKVDAELGYYTYYTGGFGGGILVQDSSYADGDCAALTMKGVIIAGNTAEEQGRELLVDGPNYCTPTATGNAFNLFGRGGNSGVVGFTPGATDIIPTVGLNAILSPLADNGGPTMTHALPQGSPALDLAPNASCIAAPVNGVDQRGEARNQNGAGGVTSNDCDAGSFERQAGGGGGAAFLVSPAGSGSVGGVAFAPADILKYDPAAGWSMYFDGSDVGITKNLSAFAMLNNGDILMTFSANQNIAGVGTFMPQDIARFDPTATGPNTAGSFQWALDGSTVGLASNGEKIDALTNLQDSTVALSTSGGASVMLPNGNVMKEQDEDVILIDLSFGSWAGFFDGTAVPGLKGEDVNALWLPPNECALYISILGGFNLSGVAGNGRDIVKLTCNGNGNSYSPSLWWDGSAAGFPVNVDGLEILP